LRAVVVTDLLVAATRAPRHA